MLSYDTKVLSSTGRRHVWLRLFDEQRRQGSQGRKDDGVRLAGGSWRRPTSPSLACIAMHVMSATR
eukprot:scaffold1531_cov296-Prasinococcus_capsulatus_cf.AAC.1